MTARQRSSGGLLDGLAGAINQAVDQLAAQVEATNTVKPGTELDTVVDAEIVDEAVPLSEKQANALNDKIRAGCTQFRTSREHLQDLLEQAHSGAIHTALGYQSWTHWFADNVIITPTDKAERQSVGRGDER